MKQHISSDDGIQSFRSVDVLSFTNVAELAVVVSFDGFSAIKPLIGQPMLCGGDQ